MFMASSSILSIGNSRSVLVKVNNSSKRCHPISGPSGAILSFAFLVQIGINGKDEAYRNAQKMLGALKLSDNDVVAKVGSPAAGERNETSPDIKWMFHLNLAYP